MTRRKKRIYAAILALAGSALLLDRVMLVGPPQAASADNVAHRSLSALGVQTPTARTPPLAPTPFPELPLHDTLPRHLRDVFAPAALAQNALLGPEQEDAIPAIDSRRGETGAVQPERFEEDHRLLAVMISDHVTVAVVDDRWLRVGDSLDGCELVEISGTGVSFRCPHGTAFLSATDDRPHRSLRQ